MWFLLPPVVASRGGSLLGVRGVFPPVDFRQDFRGTFGFVDLRAVCFFRAICQSYLKFKHEI